MYLPTYRLLILIINLSIINAESVINHSIHLSRYLRPYGRVSLKSIELWTEFEIYKAFREIKRFDEKITRETCFCNKY